MPVYTAPGSYTNVQDLSQYAAPTSSTAVGLVGAARKGRVLGQYNAATRRYNTPELITSPEQFVRTYGTPTPDAQGPYAALLYLQQGRQLYYGRVVGTGAAKATKVFDAKLTVTALSEGVWGNAIAIRIQDSFISGAKKVTVLEIVDGEAVEREAYDGLMNTATDENFYETIINKQSQYIEVEYDTSTTGQPANTTGDVPAEGLHEALSGGLDGTPPGDSEVVGGVQEGYRTGLYAFADADLVDISLLMAPGYASRNVISAIAAITEARQDCLGLIHGPLGLNATEIVDWHNAVGDYAAAGTTPSVKINSSSMALYWPWVEIYDPYNKRNVMVPPVGFAAQRIAFTDNTSEPWFAPAGVQRGRCFEALRLEYDATLGEREFMYGPGNGNAVNPIVNLPFDGIAIFGQRTMQRTASALDRINVRRLVFYMAKVLQRATRQLVFEQNDSLLWDQFKQIVSPFVADVKARRGLEDFRVICDESTNTDFRRNNNELHGYVLMVPTKTAEKIIVNFALFPSGAKLEVPQIG
jgi:phage tail sheath protein FI